MCKEPVTATQMDPETVAFLHKSGKTCDARRAWVRAGMWEVLKQLERAPQSGADLTAGAAVHGCRSSFSKNHCPDF